MGQQDLRKTDQKPIPKTRTEQQRLDTGRLRRQQVREKDRERTPLMREVKRRARFEWVDEQKRLKLYDDSLLDGSMAAPEPITLSELLELAEDMESDEEGEANRSGLTEGTTTDKYEGLGHVGYDILGKRIMKVVDTSEVGKLLAKDKQGDSAWRTLYDTVNQRIVTLSPKDIDIIRRIMQSEFPGDLGFAPESQDFHVEYKREDDVFPMFAPQKSKKQFLPNRDTINHINRIATLIQKNQYQPLLLKQRREWLKNPYNQLHDIWATDEVTRANPPVPPPKEELPDHSASYNPSPEYVEDDRRVHSSLRNVPVFKNALRERFDRCLDLYLCPRAMRLKLNVNPDSMLPALPSASSLKPFPSRVALRIDPPRGLFRRREPVAVTSMDVSPCGTFIATGYKNGAFAVQMLLSPSLPGLPIFYSRMNMLPGPITAVRFHPSAPILAIAKETVLILMILPEMVGRRPVDVDPDWCDSTRVERVWNEFDDQPVVQRGLQFLGLSPLVERVELLKKSLCRWTVDELDSGVPHPNMDPENEVGAVDSCLSDGDDRQVLLPFPQRRGLTMFIRHQQVIEGMDWQKAGKYIACSSASASEPMELLAIHNVTKWQTMHPLRVMLDRLTGVVFHPTQPYLLVGHTRGIRLYDLQPDGRRAGAAVIKKFKAGSRSTHLSVSGDGQVLSVLAGGRINWYDIEGSNIPFKITRLTDEDLTTSSFHKKLPLMCAVGLSGSVTVLHAKSQALEYPVVVPVKKLNYIKKKSFPEDNKSKATVTAWHPRSCWLFSGHEDGAVRLWTSF